jgi:hypothetical protein
MILYPVRARHPALATDAIRQDPGGHPGQKTLTHAVLRDAPALPFSRADSFFLTLLHPAGYNGMKTNPAGWGGGGHNA